MPDDPHVSTVFCAQLEYGVVLGSTFRIMTGTPPGFSGQTRIDEVDDVDTLAIVHDEAGESDDE